MAELALLAAATATVAGVSAAKGNSNIAEAQAEQAEINARQLEGANKIDAFREGQRTRSRVGAQNALTGASGLSQTGSALSLVGDELFSGLLNEAIVLSQGGQAVTRQSNIRNTLKSQSKGIRRAGTIRAVTQGINVGANASRLLV